MLNTIITLTLCVSVTKWSWTGCFWCRQMEQTLWHPSGWRGELDSPPPETSTAQPPHWNDLQYTALNILQSRKYIQILVNITAFTSWSWRHLDRNHSYRSEEKFGFEQKIFWNALKLQSISKKLIWHIWPISVKIKSFTKNKWWYLSV